VCLAPFLDLPSSFSSRTSSWSDSRSDGWLRSARVIFTACGREPCCSLPPHLTTPVVFCLVPVGLGSPPPLTHGPWGRSWPGGAGGLGAGAARALPTEASVSPVCERLGLQRCLLWRSVRSGGRLARRPFAAGGARRGLGGAAGVVSCRTVTSLNYLLTGRLELVFVRICCSCVPELAVCPPLERAEDIFSADILIFFSRYSEDIFSDVSVFPLYIHIEKQSSGFITTEISLQQFNC